MSNHLRIVLFTENETYYNDDDYEIKKNNWKDFDFGGKMNWNTWHLAFIELLSYMVLWHP